MIDATIENLQVLVSFGLSAHGSGRIVKFSVPCLCVLSALSGVAHKSDRHVQGNAIKPSRKRAHAVVACERPPCLRRNLLGQVGVIVRIAGVSIRHLEDDAAVALEQRLELLSAFSRSHRQCALVHARIPLPRASCAPSQQ